MGLCLAAGIPARAADTLTHVPRSADRGTQSKAADQDDVQVEFWAAPLAERPTMLRGVPAADVGLSDPGDAFAVRSGNGPDAARTYVRVKGL